MSTTTKVAAKGVSSLTKIAFVLGIAMALLRLLRSRQAIDFRGRVVAISGGSRGLGLNLARQLAREGAKLALIARDPRELERAKTELTALGAPVLLVEADITNESAAKNAIDKIAGHFGALDVLINNAGVIQVGPLEHMLQSDFEDAMKLHFWAPLWLSRAAIPHLKKAGAGRIANIASIAGHIAVPHMAPYVASKFALVGLSDALRNELAKDGILVTTICPGILRTGSHVMAKFKGRQEAEYRMFKLMAALPGSSTAAQSAAHSILDAVRYGDPQLIFPLPVQWASLGYNLFPNTAGLLLSTVSRFLPRPTEPSQGDQTLQGHDLENALPPSFLTQLADRAVTANNEMNGHALHRTE